MDFNEIGVNTRNWVGLAQDGNYWRVLMNSTLNLRVPRANELVYWEMFLIHSFGMLLWSRAVRFAIPYLFILIFISMLGAMVTINKGKENNPLHLKLRFIHSIYNRNGKWGSPYLVISSNTFAQWNVYYYFLDSPVRADATGNSWMAYKVITFHVRLWNMTNHKGMFCFIRTE